MILTAETIKERRLVYPCRERYVIHGKSAGLSYCGYDVTVKLDSKWVVLPPQAFKLVTIEQKISLPNDVMARVCNKSSWARRGVFVGNAVAEPGWRGYLSIMLQNQSREPILVLNGSPVAQVIFEQLDREAQSYEGKYQDQDQVPTGIRYEREGDEEANNPSA